MSRICALSVCCVLAAEVSQAQVDVRTVGPSAATQRSFEESRTGKNWADTRDFANVERGWIARPGTPDIRGAKDRLIWTFKDYDALRKQTAPATVNPVLWRQVQLNAASGLFQVSERVFQVRGYDLANMTLVEGDHGLIVIDPLLTVETARAALELYYSKRPRKPVVAVIYTHSHMDHFGGVKGVVSAEDVASGKVQILAPLNFLREAVSENVMAGNAMQRRTFYYSGLMLPKGPLGSVDAGLGPAVPSGTQSFIPPNVEIRESGERRTIDGVQIEFILANQTEAPSEMLLYFPQLRVLDVAEVAVHTMHNLLTPRGAQVRSAKEWASVLDRLLVEFVGRTDVMIGQHHWPTWGRSEITRHLSNQRDLYKLVHDQSLHLANKGATMNELAEKLVLPGGLANDWAAQDYYGTLQSAGKAVFQYYLGWYDGNPAKLRPLREVVSSRRYVEYMGGAEAVLTKARADYAAGNYRWLVEVLNHLIFAAPDNVAAKTLQADAFEQLGFQQTSATWRNVYLTAAQELRRGAPSIPAASRSSDYVDSLPVDLLLDFASIALSPERAGGLNARINLELPGSPGEKFGLTLANSVLNYRAQPTENPQVTLTTDKRTLEALLSRRLQLADALERGVVKGTGDIGLASQFFEALEVFSPDFNLVTP